MTSSLHNHSMYSLLDGYSYPKEYLDKAKELGLKAFAITEHGNQYSWVYFDQLKKDYPDIKMIYGVELYECFDIKEKDKDNKYFHLVALAKNERGRIALNEIITKSNFEGFYYKPRVDLNLLKPYANDLIISSACLASKLSRETDYNKCVEYVKEYKSIFPHFYLEMQSHKSQAQCEYNQKILKLAKDTNTEYIITTDSHVANKEDLYYQGRLVQVAHDSDTLSESYEGCYMQSDEEIHSIMDEQIGRISVNIGLSTTDKIEILIDDIDMPFQEPQLPTFPLPNGFNSNYEYILHLLDIGWKERHFDELSKEEQDIRRKRIDYEMSVIHQMNFDGYFLIVWDFLNYCRKANIPIGAGRGSAGGSEVCYLLNITNIDPIKYNLIFERFLNIERISYPDIDSDTSDRDAIIKYLTDKYGQERVCQIINFSYITPVVAIKDVAKVLGIPYKIADNISKRFSYDTFEEGIKHSPNIYNEFSTNDEEFNNKLKDLFDIASHLSGKVKNVSIHAGGVGIVDTKVTDYMGMKVGKKNEQVIQVDKKIVEKIGIIKFDILGVGTLDLIRDCMQDANISSWDIDVNNPKFYNDKASYDLLCSGKTDGVFQVSSFEMQSLLQRLQPRNIEELSALIALFRPDCMQFIEPYINRKNGLEEIEYIHKDMKPILENTYGCCVEKGQLISTPNGNIPIENIKENDMIYTKSGINKVKKAWCNGEKDIFELKLSNKKSIRCTKDHKILTQRGWVELQNITKEDVVAIRINSDNYNSYDKNKLSVIGLLLGDGYISKNKNIHFYNTDIDLVNKFKYNLEKAYPDCYVQVLGRDVPSGSYVYDCYVLSKTPHTVKKQLLDDLTEWGFINNKYSVTAKYKHYPSFVYSLNKDCIKTILGSYLDTDGCYTYNGYIRFKTISLALAYGTQELIRLLGYSSSITINNDNSYDIIVNNSHMLAKEMINYSIKLKYLCNNDANVIGIDGSNCIPQKDVSKYINATSKNKQISLRQIGRLCNSDLPRTINSKTRPKKFIQIKSLKKLKEICNFPSFWFNNNIKWCKIDKIINTGKRNLVYDIEVENEHNFIVNGVIVHNCIYQEQVLDIVRKFANRTYGGADKFRKAIGKKDKQLIKEESAKLYKEILDNGYEENIAKQISDDMADKGGYCFNKSHAVAYAVLCLQTAYLKAHYPVYFYKALLNLNLKDNGKINKFIVDAQNFGVEVAPPNINKSQINFSVHDNKILFGFQAISGIGENLAKEIIQERDKNGKFRNLKDLLSRVKLSDTQVVALIKSGAIPCKNKKQMIVKYGKMMYNNDKRTYTPVKSLPSLSKLQEQYGIDTDKIKTKEERLQLYNQIREKQFNNKEKIKRQNYIKNFSNKYLQDENMWEFETLSIFLNNNPFKDIYEKLTSFEDVEENNNCVIVGVISKIEKKKDRHKKQYAFITIYSACGIIETICWSSVFSIYQDKLKKGDKVAFLVTKEDGKAIVKKIKSLKKWKHDVGL